MQKIFFLKISTSSQLHQLLAAWRAICAGLLGVLLQGDGLKALVKRFDENNENFYLKKNK